LSALPRCERESEHETAVRGGDPAALSSAQLPRYRLKAPATAALATRCICRRGEKAWAGRVQRNRMRHSHDRALIPGARRRLLGSIQVGWRCSPRLAAKGAPWSGDKPTVRVAHPRLCVPLVVGCPQVLSGPRGRGDGPRNAVYGLWEGGGGPESRLLDFVKTADPFRLQVAYASYKHGPERLR